MRRLHQCQKDPGLLPWSLGLPGLIITLQLLSPGPFLGPLPSFTRGELSSYLAEADALIAKLNTETEVPAEETVAEEGVLRYWQEAD